MAEPLPGSGTAGTAHAGREGPEGVAVSSSGLGASGLLSSRGAIGPWGRGSAAHPGASPKALHWDLCKAGSCHSKDEVKFCFVLPFLSFLIFPPKQCKEQILGFNL